MDEQYEVYLAPQFINQTTGNGSTWQVVDIRTYAPTVDTTPLWRRTNNGDTMYFGINVPEEQNCGHNTSNGTTWLVWANQQRWKFVTLATPYSADDGSKGIELWAMNFQPSTWRVTDINSGSGHSRPGQYMQFLVGDTIYFSADDGSTGQELWAHNTSSHSTWRVADIRPGSSSSKLGQMLRFVLGDTIYFSAIDGSTGNELWSHNTSSNSTSRVIDLNSGSVNGIPTANYMNRNGIVVGDTIYFSGVDGSGTGIEMWAHDTSNDSTWRVTDINSGWHNAPGYNMAIPVGDTIYFDADDPQGDGNELWAHNVANGTTWQVTNISSGLSFSYPGDWMSQLVGDTLYFSSGDTSTGAEFGLTTLRTIQHGKWLISTAVLEAVDLDIGWRFSSVTPLFLSRAITITNCGRTTHRMDPLGGSKTSTPVQAVEYFFHGDTLYFSATMEAQVVVSSILHQHQTNTGGTSPRGPSMNLTPTTVRSTVPDRIVDEPPTWFGPTTAVAQAWPTSTSPSPPSTWAVTYRSMRP